MKGCPAFNVHATIKTVPAQGHDISVLNVREQINYTEVWSQVVHYPAPEHRTAALSHQAAGLYLALYFVPQVLHRDSALMRTLVDRCPPHPSTQRKMMAESSGP
jgi:hypothetical protein